MIRPDGKRKIAAALAAAGVVVIAAAAVSSARTTVILGAGPVTQPSCPANCLVEANVTGVQTSIGNLKKPFVAPSDGNLIAWSIKLGKPKKPDRRAFNREFGGSTARLAVLRQIGPRTRKVVKYRLLRQSPVVNLGKFFGTTQTFSLNQPLAIKRGNVVGLTIPSWAPALAVSQGNATRWLASRRATARRGACLEHGGGANVDAGQAQQKKGRQQPYGCTYRSARLLYQAQFVSDLSALGQ
jgi:hypothetical protein